MLRFQTHPDRVFSAILVESLEFGIDGLEDMLQTGDFSFYDSVLPFSHKVFHPHVALQAFKEILAIHHKSELYELNDYHYLLIYDALYVFSTIHNDTVKGCKTRKGKRDASQIGPFRIEKIDFDAMTDLFFWDTDFLLTQEDAFELGLEGRKAMGISHEAFAISMGLYPHPEELEIKVYDPGPQKAGKSAFFRSASKVYPDYGSD